MKKVSEIEDKIIEMIKMKGMKPGDRLENQESMAAYLNVGRGTLREAIKGLIARNILEVRQGAGTYISEGRGVATDPLGFTFINDQKKLAIDLLNVRLTLEPEIAAWAAINASENDIKKLILQKQKVEQLILQEKNYLLEDVSFHKLIAEASDNLVVSTLIPVIHRSVNLSIDLTNNALNKNTIKYHGQLLSAIKRHDAVSARYSMILHLAENLNYLKYKFYGI